jgi:hypothetical protein
VAELLRKTVKEMEMAGLVCCINQEQKCYENITVERHLVPCLRKIIHDTTMDRNSKSTENESTNSKLLPDQLTRQLEQLGLEKKTMNTEPFGRGLTQKYLISRVQADYRFRNVQDQKIIEAIQCLAEESFIFECGAREYRMIAVDY